MIIFVFVGADELVSVYKGFVDQHLLFAEAGVDPLVGLEGHFRNLEKTHQISTSEFFTHRVSSLVDGFWRVAERERHP